MMPNSKKLPPLPPPPYSGSLSRASSLSRPPATSAPHQLATSPNMPSLSRSLWSPPEEWGDEAITPQVSASSSRLPGSNLSSSRSFVGTSTSSLPLSIPLFPQPPVPPVPSKFDYSLPTLPRTKSLSAKSRSVFPFAAFKISKATRNATAWFSEHAARKSTADSMFGDAVAMTTRVRTEGSTGKVGIQVHASETVKSSIRSWLTCDFPNDESDAVLQKCRRMCTHGGLDFSVVLQEPLIDKKPPVYWAILNGTTSSKGSDAALHAVVLSLLEICQPLQETTITSIRRACMLTSNNALLQHLFWHFPALSPLTRSDAMLLSSVAGGDVVNVDETQDGTGTFIARIQIRRFRLRMRVSEFIKIEFVTSGRPALSLSFE
jgi:hypothetical protein